MNVGASRWRPLLGGRTTCGATGANEWNEEIKKGESAQCARECALGCLEIVFLIEHSDEGGGCCLAGFWK